MKYIIESVMAHAEYLICEKASEIFEKFRTTFPDKKYDEESYLSCALLFLWGKFFEKMNNYQDNYEEYTKGGIDDAE